MAKQVCTVEEALLWIIRLYEIYRVLKLFYRVLHQTHFLVGDRELVMSVVVVGRVDRFSVVKAELASHVAERIHTDRIDCLYFDLLFGHHILSREALNGTLDLGKIWMVSMR